MTKIMLFVLIALMSISLVVASTTGSCLKHGNICTKDEECCEKTKCKPYILFAGDKRCQIQVTIKDLDEWSKKHPKSEDKTE